MQALVQNGPDLGGVAMAAAKATTAKPVRRTADQNPSRYIPFAAEKTLISEVMMSSWLSSSIFKYDLLI